jgi:DNA-binding IclR family transcriptional regulator
VLCVHQEVTNPALRTSLERGRPMELFRGAAPRVILASLPTYQLRTLMLRHADRIRAAGLGATWDEFRKRLKAVRKDGYYVAKGEVDPDMVGVAAPIFRAPSAVVGSLSLALAEEDFRAEDLSRLRDLSRRCADEISAALMRSANPH